MFSGKESIELSKILTGRNTGKVLQRICIISCTYIRSQVNKMRFNYVSLLRKYFGMLQPKKNYINKQCSCK